MDNVICFYREPFLTYDGLAAIGVAAGVLCGSLLCLRFRVGWRVWLKLFVTALLGFGLGAALMKVFGMASRAIYQAAVGEPYSFRRLLETRGYVFYGGMLGYYGGIALLLPRLAPEHRHLGWDILAVSFTLFHGFARLGCYCATDVEDGWLIWSPCCYGKKMDNAFCAHFWDGRLPTQLIESAFEFLLFAVMLALLLRGGRKWRGKLPTLYFIAYPVFRYVVEFFRDDAVRGALGPFSFSQLISLLILLGVLAVSMLRQRGAPKSPPEDAAERTA